MFMRSFAASIALAVILLVPFSAFAQPGVALAEMIIDGQRYEIPVSGSSNKLSYLGGESGYLLETSEFRVMISGEMDYDPYINYGIAVTDFGTPSSFAFIFSTPIVPTSSPNVVEGSVVGGFTDSTGNGGFITPTMATLQIAEVLGPLTNMGVDIGPSLVVPAGNPGALTAYGPFSTGIIAGPVPGPWTTLRTTTSFNMSGSGDTFVLTGFASINEIPEPSTIALAMLGGLGIYGLLRRRK